MGMTICPSKSPKLSQDKSLNSIFKTPLNKHLSASDQHPSDQPPLSQKVGSLDKSGLPEKVREYPIASITGTAAPGAVVYTPTLGVTEPFDRA